MRLKYIEVLFVRLPPICRLLAHVNINVNPRPPKEGWLFTDFYSSFSLPDKLHQTLLCNHFYILYASFDVYKVKFGGAVWVRGGVHQSEWCGGLNPMKFCPFLKY